MKNYYYILGLELNATIVDIKTAHRSLSKKFHPDLNPNDSHSEKMFKDIQEAYECLSNSEKKRKYDIEYSNWVTGNFTTKNDTANEQDILISKNYIRRMQIRYLYFAIITILISSFIVYSTDEEIDKFFIAPVCALVLYLYFVPTIIAWNKGHDFKTEIFVINIFCFIPAIFPFGWVLLLIFSFNKINGVNAIFLAILSIFAQNQFNKNERS